jgi:formiminotetrahydrofolate cyclodeaminase
MFVDRPLQEYLDQLASAEPTPGGGAAAALSGAQAAALASMVARLTLGKADYTAVQTEIEDILPQIEQLRALFQQLMQQDSDAYATFSRALKLPRGTPEEKAARTRAVQAALGQAALVPLDVVECAATLLRLCQRIAEIGNVNLLSDIAVAAALATAAGTGAAWMVRVNLHSMKDLATVEALSSRLGEALDQIMERGQAITNIVGERT